MSSGFVIPNVSRERVLEIAVADDEIVVLDHGDDYELSMAIDPKHSLGKRIKFAKVMNTPPDNLQQGGNKSSVLLTKAPDEINTWFWSAATSMTNPELILNRIAEKLKVPWFSENDEEYWEIMGEDDLD